LVERFNSTTGEYEMSEERLEDEQAKYYNDIARKMDEYELNLTAEHRKAIDDFLAKVRNEALKIDPATAEVAGSRGFLTDPYGIYGYPENLDYSFDKISYARNPGSDIWVSFEDLPHETVEKLENRTTEEKLAKFPFGGLIKERLEKLVVETFTRVGPRVDEDDEIPIDPRDFSAF
jgi:hypothetical protein